MEKLGQILELSAFQNLLSTLQVVNPLWLLLLPPFAALPRRGLGPGRMSATPCLGGLSLTLGRGKYLQLVLNILLNDFRVFWGYILPSLHRPGVEQVAISLYLGVKNVLHLVHDIRNTLHHWSSL